MNNNQINFDPMTGQFIANNTDNTTFSQQENIQSIPTEQSVSTIQTNQTTNTNIYNQQELQNIPTVDQSKNDFINNTQAENSLKNEISNDKTNITFIVILFIIIFAAIFFLFPYLIKILGL